MQELSKKQRKKREPREMKCIIERLNQPSEQAILDFNYAFYEIILKLRKRKEI